MSGIRYGQCGHCGELTPTFKPNCARCGKWQEWGEQALANLRAERRRKFILTERREELEWDEMRAAPESCAAPGPGLVSELHRSAHFLTLRPARAVALALGAAGLFAAGMWWHGHQTPSGAYAAALPYPAPALRSASYQEPPRFICNDGSPSYAEDSRGACSKHGGIKVAYR